MSAGKFFFLFILVFSGAVLSAQVTTTASAITVRGRVYDKNDSNALPAAIILNKRTETGQNSAPGGTFSITGLKTDTFLLTAGGYEVIRISFRDSAQKDVYNIRIGLQLKTNTLAAVAIYPVMDLDVIKKQRQALGVAQTRQTQGITDAVESPITYMYERFSKEGKSKAAVAMLENEDRKHDVLKELFRTYVRAGVIDMQEEEFDQFINYLNIPEDFLKNASDYDLAVAIRQRYLQYRAAQQIHNRNQR